MKDGNLVFRVTQVQAPIPFIIGTHAQFDPKGTFVRVRLSAQNPDSVFHTVVPEDQRLADAAGHLYEPSVDAMRIKRQPVTVDLGAGNVLEFDVWFDVPAASAAHGIRVNDAQSGGCGRVLLLPPAHP